MKKVCNLLVGLLCLCTQFAFSQIGDYSFKRPLSNVSEKWQKVVLPVEVYGKLSPDFRDLRIFGITRSGDTVETPYILRESTKNSMHKDVTCKVFSKTKKDTGYIVSFENSTRARVNHLFVDLDTETTDRLVALEGSRDGTTWSVVSQDCDVSYGTIGSARQYLMKISFPTTQLRYLRLLTKGLAKPDPRFVRIAYEDLADKVLRGLAISKVDRREDRNAKITELDVEMRSPVPMEWIKVHVRGTFDYFRPVTISWLADSTKSQKGWIYNYVPLVSGILSSDEKSALRFYSTIVKKLRITIENQDSPPLRIDSIEVKGCVHELAASFERDVDYVLAYGNLDASRPQYDIERFTDNIPETLNTVLIEREQTIEKAKPTPVVPLFTNTAWFWLIMTAVIVVLGWFSVRMLRSN